MDNHEGGKYPSSRNNEQELIVEQRRLLSLIEYAQHSARLKHTIVKEVASHKEFCLYEHELICPPGIRFNTGEEEDEIWLVIERLWESQPPEPQENLLKVWLQQSDNPENEPSLKDVIDLQDLEEEELNDFSFDISVEEKTKLIFLKEYEQRENVKVLYTRYLKEQWKPWADEEQKRRKTMSLYAKLFTLKQQLEGAITDTQVELVWGMGIALWKTKEFNINYPLITQVVEINFNDSDMSMEIRPCQVDARFELDIYIGIDNPGVSDLEKVYNDFISKQTQAFSPFYRAFYEVLLRPAVTHLDPKGVYWPDKTNATD